ncbi:ACP S-malonyltransferase [Paenibacillus tepidiphilus]|uniref:ACP S-malonyltransferase n=1 Tax=Paenibacillus tepidiphilus TaxID=2608683 RepID=UPI001EEFD90F|nr:ACP S-malonyltransferase [Paenibacillus tepidiphilus]
MAFIFPGQGSQYAGMGQAWHSAYPIARELFELANDALGFDLRKMCFEGNSQELRKTEIAQPAILTVSLIAYRIILQEVEIQQPVLAGHSLGEISALCAAGAISFSDAVRLVHARGRFMQEAVPEGRGLMYAVVGLSSDQVNEICRKISLNKGTVVPSNYNAGNQTVISGIRGAVEEAAVSLKQAGAQVIPLKVSAPFHSPLMEPAIAPFRELLGGLTLHPLQHPVVSNVTGDFYSSEQDIIPLLSDQLIKPVLWTACLNRLAAMPVEAFVDTGPREALGPLVKEAFPEMKVYAADSIQSTMQGCLDSLRSELERSRQRSTGNLLNKCLSIAVCTRNHNSNADEYQQHVIEPYKIIQRMREEAAHSGKELTVEKTKHVLHLLETILKGKKLPSDELNLRLEQAMNEAGMPGLFQGIVDVTQ